MLHFYLEGDHFHRLGLTITMTKHLCSYGQLISKRRHTLLKPLPFFLPLVRLYGMLYNIPGTQSFLH